jgi:hypothetical protein
MASELWLPAAVIVTIIDVVVIMVWTAKFTDRSLEATGSRWRFSLTTLLVATALIAVHAALLMQFFRP